MTEVSGRRRFRVDPWGPLLAAAAAVVFLLQGFAGPLTRDLALYAYSAQQFAEGAPPYVGVLNRAGPLAHIVPGVATVLGRAVGVDDVLAMRGALMALSVVCVWAAYLLARDAFGSRLAGAAASVTLLALHGFVVYATGGPREKTTMVLFTLLALWALGHRRWLLAGAATAAATLAWQPIFFPLAVVALVAAVLVPQVGPSVAALVRFAVGGVAVTAAMVAYFLVVGAVEEFYEGFAAIHLAGYTNQHGLLRTLEREPYVLLDGFGWSTWLLATGCVAVLVVGALRLRRIDRSSGGDGLVVGLGAGALVALLWSFVAFQDWPDAFILVPFATMGVAGLLDLARRGLPARWGVRPVAVTTAVTLVAAAVTSWATRPAELGSQRREARTLVAAAGPGASIQSINAPGPLVFTGLRNPSRHQMFIGGLEDYLDDTYPGGLDGFGRELEQRQPTFVTYDRARIPAWLGRVLDEHYQRVGRGRGGHAWYVTETIEPRRLRRMRELILRGQEQPGAATVKRSVP